MTDAPRILVTRPVGQCEALCEALIQAGFQAEAVPVIDIVPHPHREEARRRLAGVDEAALLIFVSRNAVRFAAPDLPDTDNLDVRIAAVGPSTAEALREAGLRCDVTPEDGFTSEALLSHPVLNDVAGKNVIIVRGEGGRALLGDTLTERGAQVTYAEVYQRDVPANAADRLNAALKSGVDAMTATSVETLSNIDALAAADTRTLLHDVTIVTVSERVLKKAQALGYTQEALLATAPDDSALVDALVHWRKRRAANEPETAHMATDTPDHDSKNRDDKHDGDGEQDASFDEADLSADQSEGEAAAEDAAETVADAPSDLPPEPQPEPEPSPPVTAPPSPPAQESGGGGRGIALLALLLSLVAAALGALGWNTARQSGGAVEAAVEQAMSTGEDPKVALEAVATNLRSDIETIRDDVGETAKTLRSEVDRKLRTVDLDPINEQVEEVASEQSALSRRVSGQQRAIDTVTERLGSMESDLSALQGVSDTVRNTWVRAEAEYFLQTANSRLQLASDVPSALSALRAADERIGTLGDPGLIPVRAKITEEILAVEGVPLPDVEGLALVLLGMSERVPELPLTGDKVPTRYDAPKIDDGDNVESGWERAAGKVTSAFSNIVRVSPSEGGAAEAIVPPEDVYFIYRNLQLNLTIARLALMRQDTANFQGSVKEAMTWLETHYDTTKPGVSTMLTRLNDMAEIEIDPDVPDISESLRMLRALVAKSSVSQ